MCALLLEWLAGVALDYGGPCPRDWPPQDRDVVLVDGYSPVMVAARALRPVLYLAVAPFLDDLDADVRDTALSAALVFAEHPDLAGNRDDLAGHARRLLRTSDRRWRRRQALEALTAWGHDTAGLIRPGDDDRSPYVAGASWPGGGRAEGPGRPVGWVVR